MDEGCEGEEFLIEALTPLWQIVLIEKKNRNEACLHTSFPRQL